MQRCCLYRQRRSGTSSMYCDASVMMWVSGPSVHNVTATLRDNSTSACAAVLLIKAAHLWHKQHGSSLPSSASQRSEFKDIIKSWQRQIDGIPLEVRQVFLAMSQARRLASQFDSCLLTHLLAVFSLLTVNCRHSDCFRRKTSVRL